VIPSAACYEGPCAEAVEAGQSVGAGVTVEVGRPIAEARVLGAEVFVPRAGLSARQTSVPPRRSASPIAEGVKRAPESGPLRLDFEEPADPCPSSFLAGQVRQTLATQEPQSQG
jgi:hypothetical protein